MLKQDGTPDKRFKENKGIGALMSLAYVLIIGIFLYIGWAGFIRLFTGEESDKNDELAFKAAGIHSLALVGIFIAGVCTEGTTQDWFIETTVLGIVWSIIFIIVGLIFYLIPVNKK